MASQHSSPLLSRLFYGPGDWLSHCLTVRQRRAVGAWLMIFWILAIPATYPWKDAIWLVWLLSVLALVLSMAGVVAAETPVEGEESD